MAGLWDRVNEGAGNRVTKALLSAELRRYIGLVIAGQSNDQAYESFAERVDRPLGANPLSALARRDLAHVRNLVDIQRTEEGKLNHVLEFESLLDQAQAGEINESEWESGLELGLALPLV